MRITAKRRVAEISEQANRPRVHHGQLAEQYDGIGRFVLVSLSRSSVSAAYKARIASGDFATGQTIPVGTPIIITSIRGRLEVVSLGAK